MGVVRREDDWRLEKREEGVYVVTYQGQPKLKIITADYDPTGLNDERADLTIPVREVESFSDATDIFNQTATGQQQAGFGGDPLIPQDGHGGGDPIFEPADNDEMSDIPPGGLLLVGVLVGGVAIREGGFNLTSPVTLFGIGMLLMAVVALGLTYRVYATEGLGAAIAYLVTVDAADEDTKSSDGAAGETTEKTPPTPKRMKENIFFDRADQLCEWCGERTDSPEIHHIKPRSEGGPNEYDNLIALCPTCHSKADKGGISQTKLEAKTSRQMKEWSKGE